MLAAGGVALLSILPVSAELADKAPLDAFKKEVQAIETFTKEQEAGLKDNPMGGIVMIRKIVTKVKAVKTEGLPADLKEAYANFTNVLAKMGELFTDWPEKPEEVLAFVTKRSAEDPEFMKRFGEKMAALEMEMKPVTESLDAVSAKYGIDSSAFRPLGR